MSRLTTTPTPVPLPSDQTASPSCLLICMNIFITSGSVTPHLSPLPPYMTMLRVLPKYWAFEAYSTSTNPNIFLVRLCCSQHETDEEVIPSRQTNSLVINQTLLMPHQDEPNSLVINQRVWFVLFVVNQFHRHIWLLGLSCLLATNFTVIFGCLVCLVCYQPISPSYLVVLITSKRGKHISAGTLATVLASYVVLISWK